MIYLLQHIGPYFKFYWRAKTIHQIHSPYLFDFLSHTIEDSHHFYAFKELTRMHKKMIKDKKLIEIKSPGPDSKTLRKKKVSVGEIASNVASDKEFCEFLFKTVDYLKASRILELGSSIGVSALFMHFARPSAQIVSIEGNRDLHIFAQKLAETYHADIDFMHGTFQEKLHTALNQLEYVDFLFLDGDHRGEATIDYLNRIKPYLSEKAVVVVDDIRWSEDMLSTWNKIRNGQEVRASIDLYRRGILFFNQAILEPVHVKLIQKRYKPWMATL